VAGNAASRSAAALDLVTVLQIGGLDHPVVDLGAVAAAQIGELAQGRIGFHEEVHPREVGIVGQAEMGFRRPADEEGVVPVEAEGTAGVGTGCHGQEDRHGSEPFRVFTGTIRGLSYQQGRGCVQ
jgi:hypothetical protein